MIPVGPVSSQVSLEEGTREGRGQNDSEDDSKGQRLREGGFGEGRGRELGEARSSPLPCPGAS